MRKGPCGMTGVLKVNGLVTPLRANPGAESTDKPSTASDNRLLLTDEVPPCGVASPAGHDRPRATDANSHPTDRRLRGQIGLTWAHATKEFTRSKPSSDCILSRTILPSSSFAPGKAPAPTCLRSYIPVLG